MKSVKIMMLLAMLSFSCVSINAKGNTTKATKSTSMECPHPSCTGVVSICGDGVRIRQSPSLKGKILGKANWYAQFTCLGVSHGWYKIRYRGKIAYVSAQFATHECPD